MISRAQYKLPHIYASAADLSEATYRSYLRECAGCNSCKDDAFEQAGFERLMAALETVLWDRVDRGLVPDPRGRSRYILSRDYWRRRQPGRGMATSRQTWEIGQLWMRLQSYVSAQEQSAGYLLGIVRKATCRPSATLEDLRISEAASVIDALKDRLQHSMVCHAN